MLVYLTRRLFWLVITLLVITAITFVIYFVLPPVSPAVLFAGKEATPQLVATVQHELGLDHPVWVQYLLFLKHLVLGDQFGWPGLGFSYVNHSSVKSLLAGRVVVTLVLAVGAALLWLAMGITIGVISAIRQRSVWDRLALGFAIFFISAPVFWLGLVLLWVFWYKLGVAAGTGYFPPGQYGLLTWLDHMILPWFTLALLYAGWYARMTRGAVLDTLRQDYVRTAQAKGLADRLVIGKHALKNALISVVTVIGLQIGALLGNTIITESLFALPGVGRLMIDSVFSRDFFVVQGVILFLAVGYVVANLVVDILYSYLDPRIRVH